MTTRTFIQRWRASRARFGDARSWLLGLYSGLLLRRRGWPLPGRGAIVRVRFAGQKGDYFVRLGTSDLLVAGEMFREGEYAPVLDSDLGDVRAVVDLGANVGLSIRLWQERFPNARIVGVEPDASNMEVCRRNVGAGLRPERVTLIQACVAGERRRVVLDRSDLAWGFRMKDRGAAGNGGTATEVEAIPLPDVLGRAGMGGAIDLLKCDIEGAEVEVFAGCAEWIGGVRHLVVETHAPYSQELFAADLRRAGSEFSLRTLKRFGPVSVTYAARRDDRQL